MRLWKTPDPRRSTRRQRIHEPASRRSVATRLLCERLEDRTLLDATAIRQLAGFTASVLGRNDDGSTGQVPLGFDVNYYGIDSMSCFVNNNGNITFDSALSNYTPFDLTSTGRQIIAPFFADVDTRGAASSLVTYGTDTVDDRAAFGVDWLGVGYYAGHTDKLDSFQLVLIDRSDIAPGDFDFEFNYETIDWETGDASGGLGGLGGASARAGYSNGTRQAGTSFEFPGSAVNGALLDSGGATALSGHSLNSDVPGRYVFNVRSGVVSESDLAVATTAPSAPVILGQTLTYTLTVTNQGPATATGVSLVDTLPDGVDFVSADSSQGTSTEVGGVLTCDLGDLDGDASVTIILVVKPQAQGTLTNTASVAADQPDPDPVDNVSTTGSDVAIFDLDIDSDNNDGLNPPDRSAAEEDVENIAGVDATPGKVLLVDNGDSDRDGIPNFADGFGLDPAIPESVASPGTQFVPMILEVGDPINCADVTLTIAYSASDPADIGASLTDPFLLPDGKIRLWMKDGSQPRSAASVLDGGDFLAPGDYTCADLGITDDSRIQTIYVEAIRPSETVADIVVSVDLHSDADGGLDAHDQVRLTATSIEIDAANFGQAERFPVTTLVTSDLTTAVAGAPPDPIDPTYFSSPLDLTPGDLQSYVLNIHDPRVSGLENAYINDQPLPLIPTSDGYTTDPFLITAPGDTGDSLGYRTIALSGDAVTIRYNPQSLWQLLGLSAPASDGDVIEAALNDALRTLGKTWQPTDPINEIILGAGNANAADPGLFGKVVDALMSRRLNQDGWLSSIWVSKTDSLAEGRIAGQIVNIGSRTSPPGFTSADLMQVDVIKLQPGQSFPTEGGRLMWDANAVEDLYEIKASVSGIKVEQANELINLMEGRDITLLTSPEVYSTKAGMLVPNKRFLQVLRVLEIMGMVGTAYAVLNHQAYAAEFEDIRADMRQFKAQVDAGNTQEARRAAADVLIAMNRYMSNFTPGGHEFVNIGTYYAATDLYTGVVSSPVPGSKEKALLDDLGSDIWNDDGLMGPPAAPAGLTAVAASSTQINLTWSGNAGDTGVFVIERKGGADADFTELPDEVGAGQTSFIDSDVSPGTTYTYRVQVFDDPDSSGYSNEATATTLAPPLTPPVAPSDLEAQAVSPSQIDLSWSDNSDNEAGFQIERKQGPDGDWVPVVPLVPANVATYSDRALQPDTEYFYRVHATNQAGDSDTSPEASATTPDVRPTAPVGLTATTISATRIDLQWSNTAANASEIDVQRWDGEQGEFVTIARLGPDQIDYSDTACQPATTYQYRVLAGNVVGDSDPSGLASATTPAVLPDVPDSLTAWGVSRTEIDLQWVGSPDADGYVLERKIGAAGAYTPLANLGADATSYSDAGLTGGVTYYYHVQAFNAAGRTGFSNEAWATPFVILPAAPRGLSATALSSSQIVLYWYDYSDDEDGFIVERSTAGGHFATLVTLGPDSSNFLDAGLSPSTAYSYRVRAFNSDGSSGASNVASATTFPVIVDTTPPTAQVAAVIPNPRNRPVSAITISFSEPVSGLDKGDLRLTRDGAAISLAAATLTPVDHLARSWSLGSLTGSTTIEGTFTLSLIAAGSGIIDAAGNALAADASSSWVMDTTPPTVVGVADVKPNPRSAPVASVDVAFSESIDLSTFDEHDLRLTRDGVPVVLTSAVTVGQVPGSATSYRVGGLGGFTAAQGYYALTIDASGVRDLAGNAGTGSAAGSWVIDTTRPTAEILDVTPDPTAVPVPDLTILFSEPVTGFDLADLTLSRDGGGNLLTTAQTLTTADGITWTLGNLASLTGSSGVYTLTLIAAGSGIADAAGNVLAGDVATSFTVVRLAPPASPGGLTATAVSRSEIDLTWSDDSNDEEGFLLERKVGPTGSYAQIAVLGANVTSYADTGLVAATTYVYRVRAYNALGDSDYSNEAVATTPGTVPAAPVDLTATGVSSASIELSWENYNANPSGFLVERKVGATGTYAQIATLGPGVTSYTDVPVAFLTLYSYRVRTYDATGVSAYSNEVSAASLSSRNSVWPAPSALTATPASSSRIDLSWADNTGGAAGSKVERKAGPTGTYAQVATVGAGVTHFSDTGLSSGTTYYYRVRASDLGPGVHADSPYSNVAHATTLAPTASITGVSPDPRNTGVPAMTIVFNEPVTGFDLADLNLSRGGGVNLLTTAQTLATADHITWTLGNLSGLTSTAGSYTLTLTAAGSGIIDAAGNRLTLGVSAAFTVDTIAPTARILDVTPDPRNTTVDQIGIIFSEPVTGFDLADLSLTRDGGGNLLTAGQTLTTADQINWTLGGLSSLTKVSGTYTFTLTAAGSGITDAAGNRLAGDAVEVFTITIVPTVYTVNLPGNSGTGSGLSGDLRYAINQANASTNPGGGVIQFDPTVFATPQTITLHSALVLTGSSGPERIVGPGADRLTLSGGNIVGVFSISHSTTATIAGLTISGGSSLDGAGIFNLGNLTVSNSAIEENSAGSNGGGGGIYNAGTLAVVSSIIDGNSAAAGAGILNDQGGSMTLTNVTLAGNSNNGLGGAIYNNLGTATVTGSTITHNSATNGGGGIFSQGTITLTDTNIAANSGADGGGILSDGGTVTVNNCTISDNSASDGGGGIANLVGALTVTNATIADNSAGYGGGIFNYGNGTMTALNGTIADNHASSAGRGGGLDIGDGTATLDNTIVALNTDGVGAGAPADDIALHYVLTFVAGTVSSASSHNLIGTGGAGGLTNGINGNLVGVVEPGLGTLASNGGPTQTIALRPGSPAIDAGSNALAVDTQGNALAYDQRGPGFLRVVDGGVDIGAFEATIPVPALVSISPDRIAVGYSRSITLIVTGSGFVPQSVVEWNNTALPTSEVSSSELTAVAPAIDFASAGNASITVTNPAPGGGDSNGLTFQVLPAPTIVYVNSAWAPDSPGTPVTWTDGSTHDIGYDAFATIQDGADAIAVGGTVNVAAGTYIESVTITKGLTIGGAGQSSVLEGTSSGIGITVQASGVTILAVTIRGFGGDGIDVASGASADLSGDTITGNGTGVRIENGGTATITGSTLSHNATPFDGEGGGIDNLGTMAITDSLITDNVATFGDGGGIVNYGSATVTDCTIARNSADFGGGIDDFGRLTITGTTLANNSAAYGGGIESYLGTVTIINSTIAENSATDGGGGIDNSGTMAIVNSTIVYNSVASGSGVGGGLNVHLDTVTLDNTIVALNTRYAGGGASADDIDVFVGSTFEGILSPASAFNLIGTGGAGGLTNGINGNHVGVSAPGLGALSDNGGPTQTIALLPGSPAIDAGSNALALDAGGNPLLNDQRDTGFPRVVNGMVDIGAFEAEYPIVDAVGAIAPNPRNSPVSSVDVTFSEPIDLRTVTASALTLTDNGGPDLITDAVTFNLVSGSTYQVGGLAGLTTAEGTYTLTVDAAGIPDPASHSGYGSVSASWLMDTTPSTSTVGALPRTALGLSFPVTVSGSDPNGAGGAAPSGIASFTIYVATGGAAWQRWTTVAPTSTSGATASATATFIGQSNTIYAFYAIATDQAGNLRAYQPSIEASTYVPNLTPPVTSIGGGSYNNDGTFTLNLSGSDPGGGVLTYLQAWVAIDAQPPVPIGSAIPAGTPSASGVYSAAIRSVMPPGDYGPTHIYRFSTAGFDSAGHAEVPHPTPGQGNFSVAYAAPAATQLAMTGLTVQHGAAERSFIRYLDLDFNDSDSNALQAIINSVNSPTAGIPAELTLSRYNLSGGGAPVPVSLQGLLSLVDNAIEIDFGSAGLGGSPNATAADGYYALSFVPSGAAGQPGLGSTHNFYRLLGDVTGEGVVDNNDLNAIAAEISQSSPSGFAPLGADVNGDGSVTGLDQTLATRSKGHKLGAGLPLG